jgi:hypothetical protein
MTFCVDAYVSFALVFVGVHGDHWSGHCYRERAWCESAKMAADAAFGFVATGEPGLVDLARERGDIQRPWAECRPQSAQQRKH